MAQLVKLKRSSVAAKVPAVGDLELGELAINTYDGLAYLKKDDGTESIVTFATKEYVDNSVSRTVESKTGDGTTTGFTLTNTYTTGKETMVDVFTNGLLQTEGSSKDYTLTGTDTLTFSTAPSNGSSIIIKIIT